MEQLSGTRKGQGSNILLGRRHLKGDLKEGQREKISRPVCHSQTFNYTFALVAFPNGFPGHIALGALAFHTRLVGWNLTASSILPEEIALFELWSGGGGLSGPLNSKSSRLPSSKCSSEGDAILFLGQPL